MTGVYTHTSLALRVAAAVKRRGAASLDDVAPEFPKFTREQVRCALQNATSLRHLQLKVRGNAKAKRASVWEPTPFAQPKVRLIEQRPPNSAWELAHGRQIAGEWPPTFENGRRFNLLGPWNEEATNDNHRSAA